MWEVGRPETIAAVTVAMQFFKTSGPTSDPAFCFRRIDVVRWSNWNSNECALPRDSKPGVRECRGFSDLDCTTAASESR